MFGLKRHQQQLQQLIADKSMLDTDAQQLQHVLYSPHICIRECCVDPVQHQLYGPSLPERMLNLGAHVHIRT